MSLSPDKVRSLFEKKGGAFITPLPQFIDRLTRIKALVFDWDGVFNPGQKGEGTHSNFSEPDSLGTNMLRYALYQNQQKVAPKTAIITGAQNPTALSFAQREHFNAVYMGILHKYDALNHFCQTHRITPQEVAFFYDDPIDLPIAAKAGINIQIRRPNSPLFDNYVAQHEMADYATCLPGGQNAVREACELLMGLLGLYDNSITDRIQYTQKYATFFDQRNQANTTLFRQQADAIAEANN